MTLKKKKETIRKYDNRAKSATKLHNLNHAGYLLILIQPLQKQIRKRFGP